MIGGGTASEAQGLFSIDPSGLPLKALISNTLQRYVVSPQALGMVVAHGNGSYLSDVTEAQALSAVFAETQVPVTAFKWSMGHTLCASGILDTVLGTYAMQHQCIPGIANLNAVATECSTLDVRRETRPWDPSKDHMLVINRGFGGMNACMVFRACR